MGTKKKFAKIRLYHQSNVGLKSGAVVVYLDDRVHYIRNVMRAKLDDTVILFDGISGEWDCTISKINRDCVEIKVSRLIKEYVPTRKLALCISLVKIATMRNVIRQATESGVTLIKPIRTEYSSVEDINIEKCKLWAVESAEQCGRQDIPQIDPVGTLEEVCELGYETVLCDESGGGEIPKNVLSGKDDICIIIGPEGGFSFAELQYARKFFLRMSLGERLLRVDTAVVSALAYVNEYYYMEGVDA